MSQPEIYAPPAQRKPLDQEVLVRVQPMLDMGDPTSERAFVNDIDRGVGTQPWRWTGQRPTIRLTLRSALNFQYHIEFTIADATFKQTGPVTVTFLVNDQVLDRATYNTPGAQVFDKPIPNGMLRPLTDNTLAAEIDKPFVSPTDGHKLGFILTRFGLQQ